MKKLKINEKEYNLPNEVVDYIRELEYYYSFKIGKRVIDVHYGMVGHIVKMFHNYHEIPAEMVHGDYDEYAKTLGVYIDERLKNAYWFLVKKEETEEFYLLPYVYWKIMPEDEDIELPQADSVTDV